jgi:hypothetical protein
MRIHFTAMHMHYREQQLRAEPVFPGRQLHTCRVSWGHARRCGGSMGGLYRPCIRTHGHVMWHTQSQVCLCIRRTYIAPPIHVFVHNKYHLIWHDDDDDDDDDLRIMHECSAMMWFLIHASLIIKTLRKLDGVITLVNTGIQTQNTEYRSNNTILKKVILNEPFWG